MPTLQEIVTFFQKIELEIINAQGELSEELEQAIEEVLTNLVTKGDAYGHVLNKLELSETYWNDKSKAFKDIANRMKKTREYMRERLKDALVKMERDSLVCDEYKFSRSKCKQKLVITDETKIPKHLRIRVEEWVPDKEIIKAVLEGGGKVEGAHLEGGEKLTVRLRGVKDE